MGRHITLGTPVVAPLGLALVAVALRLPYLDAPLTADEGGYAEISRLWAHGATLYGQDWVDRPQGLLLVFRGALAAGLGSTIDLRLLAACFGAAGVVLAYALGVRLSGRPGGAIAALFVATAGASPFIESFTLAGELIAATVSASAILAFTRYDANGHSSWLLAAGLLAGSAWMVKQSAFDAVAAVVVYVALRSRRDAVRPLALFLTAAAAPIAVGVIGSGDAASWYGAIVGYGAHASGTGRSIAVRASLLWSSLDRFGAALGAPALVALAGWTRSHALLKIWTVASVGGVLVGGNFSPHYYLQLVTPVSLLAGSFARSGRGRLWLAVGAAAAVSAVTIPLWTATDDAQAKAIWPGDLHLRSDGAVVRVIERESRPGESLYVVWAAADLYYLADRPPAVRYLWLRNIQTIESAVGGVRDVLSRKVPALVVVEQRPRLVDPTGGTEAVLRRNYRRVARVDGVDVYRRR